jgi:hypothetical protein
MVYKMANFREAQQVLVTRKSSFFCAVNYQNIIERTVSGVGFFLF